MSSATREKQDVQVLAAIAHGSILLGIVTNGVGGIFIALIIWLSQRGKSEYVSRQSLQALVYQSLVAMITFTGFCLWGIFAASLVAIPMIASPELYQDAPPPSMWIGVSVLILPCGLWLLTIVYGLWGAIRCLAGDEFEYVIVGRWLAQRTNSV